MYYVTMQITFLTRKFRNWERNLHCDVVHITTKWVSSLALDCNGVFAINAYDTFLLALALLYKLMSISFHIFLLPLLGLLSGVKPHLKLLTLVIPYSGNPKIRYYIVFTLGPFYINKSKFYYPCFLLTSKGDFEVKAYQLRGRSQLSTFTY